MSEQATLRDALESSFEAAETEVSDRPRDEMGRFAPKETEPEVKAEAPIDDKQTLLDTQAPPEPQRPPRPSSWKKDYWDHWDKLDPSVASYIHEREQQYAKGVSTYKNEWEQAKPLLEAIAPFQPVLQQNGITPDQWIKNLGNAHHTLAMGSPQQKVQMFQQLARDYGVPLEYLTGQQTNFDPLQAVNPLWERVQQLEGKLTGYLTTQEQAQQRAIQDEIGKFAESHPHFEAVRETMAGLLQSNVAQDLQTAYEKAVRLHDDLFQQEIEAKAQADAAKRLEENAKLARQAKAKAISPKGNTPLADGGGGKKGLREQLAEQVEAQLSGRV